MAVILEGIVLSLVIPGSLGQTDMPSHQLLLRSFTCFFLHPWKSWKLQVPSPQNLHKCHSFGSATLARHISLHKKAMMLTLDAWPCLPFSSQTSRSGPMRDIFGMGGYQHGVTLVCPRCDKYSISDVPGSGITDITLFDVVGLLRGRSLTSTELTRSPCPNSLHLCMWSHGKPSTRESGVRPLWWPALERPPGSWAKWHPSAAQRHNEASGCSSCGFDSKLEGTTCEVWGGVTILRMKLVPETFHTDASVPNKTDCT